MSVHLLVRPSVRPTKEPKCKNFVNFLLFLFQYLTIVSLYWNQNRNFLSVLSRFVAIFRRTSHKTFITIKKKMYGFFMAVRKVP